MITKPTKNELIGIVIILIVFASGILMEKFVLNGSGEVDGIQQDIWAFVELEDYLRASGEKHNVNYLRLLFHYGNNDSVIVNKHFYDNDVDFYYRIYHTVNLNLSKNSLGEERITNTFHVGYEASHRGGMTYPLLTYRIIGGEHDGWWGSISSNENLTISLYENCRKWLN